MIQDTINITGSGITTPAGVSFPVHRTQATQGSSSTFIAQLPFTKCQVRPSSRDDKQHQYNAYVGVEKVLPVLLVGLDYAYTYQFRAFLEDRLFFLNAFF